MRLPLFVFPQWPRRASREIRREVFFFSFRLQGSRKNVRHSSFLREDVNVRTAGAEEKTETWHRLGSIARSAGMQ